MKTKVSSNRTGCSSSPDRPPNTKNASLPTCAIPVQPRGGGGSSLSADTATSMLLDYQCGSTNQFRRHEWAQRAKGHASIAVRDSRDLRYIADGIAEHKVVCEAARAAVADVGRTDLMCHSREVSHAEGRAYEFGACDFGACLRCWKAGCTQAAHLAAEGKHTSSPLSEGENTARPQPF